MRQLKIPGNERSLAQYKGPMACKYISAFTIEAATKGILNDLGRV